MKSTDINPNVVQNLVLAKHNDMDSYLSLIYTYNLTDSELLLIEQGEYPIEYVNEPIVESVEGFAGLLGRGPCVFYETVGFQVHCSHPDHQAAHADGTCSHPETTHITVTVQKDCPGSPSSTDDDIDHSGSTSAGGGGGGGTSWGGNPDNNLYDPNHPDYVEVSLLEQGALTQISLPMRSKLRNEMVSLIDSEDLSFLNNYYHLERAFNMYLSTNNNTEGYAFVDWSIDYLQSLYLSGNSQASAIPASVPENADIFDDIVHNNLNDEGIIEDLFEAHYDENPDKFMEDFVYDQNNQDPVIEDMEDYLDCFNDGKIADNYEFIMYVDQPEAGENTVVKVDIKWPLSESTGDVGHTFFSIVKNNTDGTSTTKTLGFYPADNTYLDDATDLEGAGTFKDNGIEGQEHEYDVSLSFTGVNQGQFDDIKEDLIALEDANYDLNDANCTTMAHVIAAENLGLTLTPNLSVYRWFVVTGAIPIIGLSPGQYGVDLVDEEFEADSNIQLEVLENESNNSPRTSTSNCN